MTEMAVARSMESWWRDYAFLTHEISKFVTRKDWDMVLSLLDQRATLQKQIDEQKNREFATSAAGQALIGDIMREERDIVQNIHQSRNQAQFKEKIAKAYDVYSTIPVGSLMNWGT